MQLILWFVVCAAAFINNAVLGQYSCPEQCSCAALDSSIDCRFQELTEVPDDVYIEVEILDLSHNTFWEIPKLILYTKLRKLNLSNNKINAIDEGSLIGLSNLQELDMSGNILIAWSYINPKFMLMTKSLKSLDLSHNELKGFPEDTYQRLTSLSLQKLVLDNCTINYLPNDILSKLPNVTELSMGGNKFKVLNNQQFKSSRLKRLDLTNCDIEHVHDFSLVDLKTLKHLTLAKNYKLKSFNVKSNSLKHLDVTDCNLDSIPTSLLPNLTHVEFRGNHLHTIQANDFSNMPLVHEINLTYNRIKDVDVDAFRGLKNVQIIDLSYNLISKIDAKTFSSNLNLKRLLLTHNYITEVTKFEIESLQFLDLSVCEIKTVEADALREMPNLAGLNLSYNVLSVIPDRFYGPLILKLDLSMCRVSSFNNFTFLEMRSLYDLNLIGNRFIDLRTNSLPDVAIIRLNDNAWRCDCSSFELKDLYSWLNRRDSDVDGLTCHYPEALEGFTWVKACGGEWFANQGVYQKQRVWMYAIVTALLLSFVFCVTVSMRRTRKRRVREERERVEREARDALHARRLQQREEAEAAAGAAFRNAPDPRELQRPPSYAEALLLPSLHGSQASLASRRSTGGSRHNLNKAEPKTNNNKTKRKPRRKPKAQPTTAAPVTDDGTRLDNLSEPDSSSTVRIFMESDI